MNLAHNQRVFSNTANEVKNSNYRSNFGYFIRHLQLNFSCDHNSFKIYLLCKGYNFSRPYNANCYYSYYCFGGAKKNYQSYRIEDRSQPTHSWAFYFGLQIFRTY